MRVISIQSHLMGHGTHGRLMRAYFDQSPDHFEGYWLDQDKELLPRVINRLLSYRIPGGWAERQNVDLRRFRAEVGYGLLGRRLVQRHLHGGERPVLHFHTQIGAFLSTDLMRRMPTVLTGDMTAAQVPMEALSPALRWTHAPSRLLDGRAFRAAQRIVFWSEWAARSVTNDYGVDPRKVSVIPPGVDLAALLPPDRRRQTAPRPAARVSLLFVGSDFRRKGGHDALEVFLEAFADRAEMHLVTEGKVEYSHPHVHVHRGVTAYSDRWQELYRQADIFVLPTYSEAFGLVFAEAMAAGLPVVATDINAVPEIVTDGVTGFLVHPGDRLQLAERLRRLINDVSLRRAMGDRGRAVALKKFDARTNFQRLESIFHELSDAPEWGRTFQHPAEGT